MSYLILGLALTVAAPAPKEKSAPPKVEGDWIVSSFEGMPKKIEGETKFTFTADEIKIKEGARDRSEDAKYTIDWTKTPGEIDIMPAKKGDKELKVLGLISVEGDDMKLCFAFGGGMERPKELKSDAGKGVVVIVLKRAKK